MKRNGTVKKRVFYLFAAGLLTLAALPATSHASSLTPGTRPPNWQMTPNMLHQLAMHPDALGPAPGAPTFTGQYYLSLDGTGENTGSGTILAHKPSAGATVAAAYMAAASTGFTGYQIAAGDITIDGQSVPASNEIPNDIGSYNTFADVTSLVKPKLDAAPAGDVSFAVNENNGETFNIDGEVLAVVWNDPAQTTVNTIVLFYGAQKTTGDAFNIAFSRPVHPTDTLDFAIADSYSYQGFGTQQYSTINIANHPITDNSSGVRLSTSAGGEDDSQVLDDGNGALMTVGDLGVSSKVDNAGVPDTDGPPQVGVNSTPQFLTAPNGSDLSNRSDDELYNLAPSLPDGSTQAGLFTENPSNDDNIFLAAFSFLNVQAIVNEGILLAPPTQSASTGGTATVSAHLQDSNGNPIAGRNVNFSVTAGPDAGQTGSGLTDSSGNVGFTYTNNGTAGTDTIDGSFINSQGTTVTSNNVTATFSGSGDTTPPSCALTGTGVTKSGVKYIQVTVQDTGSGLGSVLVTTAINAKVKVPTFTAGTTSPEVVVATKINQSLSSDVALKVTDVAGNVTTCDPVMTSVARDEGSPDVVFVGHVSQSEGIVHIYNGSPGIARLALWVNGTRFVVPGLTANSQQTVNISSALHAGFNAVFAAARGHRMGDATLVFADS